MTQGTYDLYWIAVDAAARGRGIGRALLAQVEAEVQARGGRLLLIDTSDTLAYASARRLYETSGYRLEAVVHSFYAPGDSLLIFAKELEQVQCLPETSAAYQVTVADLVAGVPVSAMGG